MSTAQPEPASERGEDIPEPSCLLLIKTETPVSEQPTPVEPDDKEAEFEEASVEEELPGFLVRLHFTVWEHVRVAGGWVRTLVREVLDVLDIRGFLIGSIADVAVSSRFIPRALGHWVFEPDPRAEDDAWKKMGIRAIVVGAPTVLGVYLVLRPGGSRLMWLYAAGWVVVCWITADAARLDARLRKKAKKRKAKKAEKAKKAKLAKRHGLGAADLEDAPKKEKKKKKEAHRRVDQGRPGERPPLPSYTSEQLRALAIVWVRDAIGTKNGIHLGPLWDKAKREGACKPDTPRTEFRKALEHHGITFDQVKVSGCCGKEEGHNRTGVKLTDVPPAPKAAPGDPHWRPHASVTHYRQVHRDERPPPLLPHRPLRPQPRRPLPTPHPSP
ncbi:hypothetical protein ACWF9B_08805 [Streptomyces sp. NPDC055089]